MAEKTTIKVTGLKEIIGRMRRYPSELNKELAKTTLMALTAVNEKIPPYPPELPNQTYVRTGDLGSSLGSGFSGGKIGTADVFTVKKMGGGYEGRLGTNIPYAPKVIGENQGPLFAGRWWQLKNVAALALPAIKRLFDKMADRLAKFLEGK